MASNYNPLISIGIPTYNRADGYLRETLESALQQTYQNIEIIVSDNCSTDNTEAYIKSFTDSRLRYFRQAQPIIPNSNYNFCLGKARGKYFLLLHDDDTIDRDFIETCMRAIQPRNNVGIIRTGTRIIDEHGKTIREKPNLSSGQSAEEFILAWLSRKTALYLCSTLFNTEQFKELGGLHSKHLLFQDVIAEMKLAALHGRAEVKAVKASVRKHSGERTFSAKVTDWCEDSLMLLDLMCELTENDKDLIRQKALRFFSVRNYNWASHIPSLRERWLNYWMVYKTFERSHSPIHYLANKHFGNQLKRVVPKSD